MKIPLAELGTGWLEAQGYRVVGGNPDLYGQPWRPWLILESIPGSQPGRTISHMMDGRTAPGGRAGDAESCADKS